jgi:hypothetical protein
MMNSMVGLYTTVLAAGPNPTWSIKTGLGWRITIGTLGRE